MKIIFIILLLLGIVFFIYMIKSKKNINNKQTELIDSINIKVHKKPEPIDIKEQEQYETIDTKELNHHTCQHQHNHKCSHMNQLADINDEYILPSIYENIITADEAKYIINKSSDYFKDSVIVSGYYSNIRKSKSAWLNKLDPIVNNIILRVCKITNSPFENAEHLQVVKYDPNGYYNQHYDSVSNNTVEAQQFLKEGGHRIITMLIYLNDEFTEGATRFITLDQDIKPPKYSGILFYTLDKNLKKCHPKALHAGLPIKTGNKYIANVWIRQKTYPIENTITVPI
jgi:prolyl 4-hydroxylase